MQASTSGVLQLTTMYGKKAAIVKKVLWLFYTEHRESVPIDSQIKFPGSDLTNLFKHAKKFYQVGINMLFSYYNTTKITEF